MRRLSIIGASYVGIVVGACLAERGHDVICCDSDEEKIADLNSGIIPFYEPGLEDLVRKNTNSGRLQFTYQISNAVHHGEVVFITVGTPMLKTGEADLSYVLKAAQDIGESLDSYKVIVNKSTVPVGTGNRVWKLIQPYAKEKNILYDVVSNPEFLREGSAIFDFFNMDRVIIGSMNERASSIMKEIYSSFHTTILETDLESAEMIKYASNCFLATKISFINHVANLCEHVGADVTKVAKGMGLDQRIGPQFLQAGIGYGGSCFPKDVQAFIQLSNQLGNGSRLLHEVDEINNKQMDFFIQKVDEALQGVAGKELAILGLAFKPNTDDMRYAPSIPIISKLLQLGATVKAYDPLAIREAKKYIGGAITYCDSIESTLMNSDACLILTEWEDFVRMNLEQAYQLLKQPIIIDGRNCLPIEKVRTYGFTYYSIGKEVIRPK